MPSLIRHLNKSTQRELFDDINYMNLGEMRAFCRSHGIPFAIYIETTDGAQRRSRDIDRKSVVLERIRHYLRTGEIQPATCFKAKVVCSEPPPSPLQQQDRLYYGWYDKTNPDMIDLLERLTDGRFRNGAIARILAREFWTAGKAPTFKAFASAWMTADDRGLGEHPEAAWLTDRARGKAGVDWKAKRRRIARRALDQLANIDPPV
jgi:hypothetical protein